MTMTVIISNTSPIIALAHINALDIIYNAFQIDKFYITNEVKDEIKDARSSNAISNLIKSNKLEVLSNSKKEDLEQIAYEIAISDIKPNPKNRTMAQNIGEASVIVKGKELKADFLLMDDGGGILVAKQNKFRCLRHIDLLKYCVDNEILTKSKAFELFTKLKKNYKYKNTSYYEEWGKNE